MTKNSTVVATVLLMVAVLVPGAVALLVFGPDESIVAAGTDGISFMIGVVVGAALGGVIAGRLIRSESRESVLFGLLRALRDDEDDASPEPPRTERQGSAA